MFDSTRLALGQRSRLRQARASSALTTPFSPAPSGQRQRNCLSLSLLPDSIPAHQEEQTGRPTLHSARPTQSSDFSRTARRLAPFGSQAGRPVARPAQLKSTQPLLLLFLLNINPPAPALTMLSLNPTRKHSTLPVLNTSAPASSSAPPPAAANNTMHPSTERHRSLSLPLSFKAPVLAWSWKGKKNKEMSGQSSRQLRLRRRVRPTDPDLDPPPADHDKMLHWRPPASPVQSTSSHAPLSPPASRPSSPVVILHHSAALPTSTYNAPSPTSPHHHQHHHHQPHEHHSHMIHPSQIALPPTPPPSPDLTKSSPTPTVSPRPSLRRQDTPSYLSPRDPAVQEAILRVGAWVGLQAREERSASV